MTENSMRRFATGLVIACFGLPAALAGPNDKPDAPSTGKELAVKTKS